MGLPNFLAHLAKEAREGVSSRWRLSAFRRRNPTCRIFPGAVIDDKSRVGRFTVVFNNAVLSDASLGDHTYVQKHSTILDSEIGKFCSIAGGAFVGIPQHAMSGVSTHPAFYLRNTPLAKTFSEEDSFAPSKRTIIGNDVWIGENAMVMGGVKVGTGAVIGTAAVVTRDVPDYAIVAGAPAKILRYRFSPEVVHDLLGSKWWDCDEEWLERHQVFFDDPVVFVDRLKKEGFL
jgi:acetyltransferase-like isoleucine patch superfamily enzyme